MFPNSFAMSTGSLFAGWMMHKTGKYKLLNLIFGAFPFFGVIGICFINEDSGFIQSWFSIVRAHINGGYVLCVDSACRI